MRFVQDWTRWRSPRTLSPSDGRQRGAVVARVIVLVIAAAGGACRSPSTAADPLPLLTVPFSRAVIDPRPLTGADCCTDVLAIGDINGDGRVDVVLGAQGSSGAGLVWYGAPSWERHEVSTGGFTTDGEVADLDGDGDQDIVIGDEKAGPTWFESLGQGAGWKRHSLGAGYVHDVEIGDIDGDTRLDVVTCDKNEIAAWSRSGAGWKRTLLLTAQGEGIALADVDGDVDVDVVFGARWLENPGAGNGPWRVHVISSTWPSDTRVRIADMNGDARSDVILTASEGPGHVAWFERPDAAGTKWREHRIADVDLEGAHSLVVADLDGDHDLDVVVAEMHTSPRKRVLAFVNEGGDRWTAQTLAASGSHNMEAADLDGDGDVDLIGKNYGGANRVVEYWENLSRDNFGDLSPSTAPFLGPGWQYVALDDRRDEDQQGKMGLVGTDANRDGRLDVVAGSFLYFNPGRDLAQPWKRVRIGEDVDTFFAPDVDGDRYADVIGARGDALLWLESADPGASTWTEHVIGEVPDARTQGYTTAQIETGGREELVFTRGTTLAYVRVPPRPESGPWPLVVVSTEAEESGVAAADIDRDGDADLVAIKGGGNEVMWLENPGTAAGRWPARGIGGGSGDGRWLDRVAATDLNQDGRVDVVVSEETQDWTYNASIVWFEAPGQPRTERWTRHRVAVFRSANSLDVADVDGDGDPDIVAAEHTDMRDSNGAPNNLTVIFENAGRGTRWRPHPIEAGAHSSHLGARVFDLDGDRRPEVVSMGWNQFRTLHLWWRRR
jgi:hypothetical protein